MKQISRYRVTSGSFSDESHLFFFSAVTFKYIAIPADDPCTIFFKNLLSHDFVDLENGSNVYELLSSTGLIEKTPHNSQIGTICATKNVSGNCSCSSKVSAAPRIGLALLLNQYCNIRCTYCLDGERTYQTRQFPRMSFHTAKRSIDFFHQNMNANAILSVTLFGGEPLLTFPLCSEISDYLSNLERCVEIVLQSNLTFLPPGFTDWAKKHNVRIISNIDGPREVHDKLRPHKRSSNGSYDSTVSSLEKLRDASVGFHLRATVTNDNVRMLQEVEELHLKLGAISSRFGLLRPIDSDGLKFSTDSIPRYEVIANEVMRLIDVGGQNGKRIENDINWRMNWRAKNTSFCGSDDLSGYTISSDGDVYSCAWFVGNESLVLGNVHSDDSPDQLRPAEVLKRQDVDKDSTCSSCSYLNACGGGCSVTRVLTDSPIVREAARQQQCAKVVPVVQRNIRRDFYGAASLKLRA